MVVGIDTVCKVYKTIKISTFIIIGTKEAINFKLNSSFYRENDR